MLRFDGYYYCEERTPINILIFFPRHKVAHGPLSHSMYAGSKEPNSSEVRNILFEIAQILDTLGPEPLRRKSYQKLWDLFILGTYTTIPEGELTLNIAGDFLGDRIVVEYSGLIKNNSLQLNRTTKTTKIQEYYVFVPFK